MGYSYEQYNYDKSYGDNYDDYNVFDYPNYNTEDLESCQELIEEYEKAVKKWFGDSS